MKRILLLNAGWSDNLGDKAIRITIEKLIENRNYEVEFLDISDPNERCMNKIPIDYGVKCFEKKYIKHKIIDSIMSIAPGLFKWFYYLGIPLLKNFNKFENKNFDLVIIGGGQLIYSNPVFENFAFGLLMWFINLTVLRGIPIAIFGVGAVDNYSKTAKRIYSFVLKRCRCIYVRDYHSMEVLKDKFNVCSKYVPDVAFYFSKISPVNKITNKFDTALIGIYTHDYYTKTSDNYMSKIDYYNNWYNYLMDIKKKGYDIKLFYTTLEDRVETINFSKFLKDDKKFYDFEIAFTDTLDILKDEFARSKIVCSARMHALILSMQYDCKIVPYIISQKLNSYKEQYLKNDFDLERIRSQIDKCLDEILWHRADFQFYPNAPGRLLKD